MWNLFCAIINTVAAISFLLPMMFAEKKATFFEWVMLVITTVFATFSWWIVIHA